MSNSEWIHSSMDSTLLPTLTDENGTTNTNSTINGDVSLGDYAKTNNTDQLTIDQVEQIRTEIASEQPLIGPPQSVSNLLTKYQDTSSPGFIPGIHYLSNHFSSMRQVRGDGNCFYRALLFGFLENLLKMHLSGNEQLINRAQNELQRITTVIQGSLQELINLGYPEFALEGFHEEFLEILNELFQQSINSLLDMFQESGKADYLTWYLRVLTAGYLKRDPDRFLPFIDGLYFDIASFCTAEVEPMNKECEQIQIIALTEYLGITIEISYLDGR